MKHTSSVTSSNTFRPFSEEVSNMNIRIRAQRDTTIVSKMFEICLKYLLKPTRRRRRAKSSMIRRVTRVSMMINIVESNISSPATNDHATKAKQTHIIVI